MHLDAAITSHHIINDILVTPHVEEHIIFIITNYNSNKCYVNVPITIFIRSN